MIQNLNSQKEISNCKLNISNIEIHENRMCDDREAQVNIKYIGIDLASANGSLFKVEKPSPLLGFSLLSVRVGVVVKP